MSIALRNHPGLASAVRREIRLPNLASCDIVWERDDQLFGILCTVRVFISSTIREIMLQFLVLSIGIHVVFILFTTL